MTLSHGNHDDHSTTLCFFANYCNNVVKNYPVSNTSWDYSFPFGDPKLCEVIDISFLIWKIKLFMGVGVLDFREGRTEK